jgi:Skp family chaperone for outer membrane proteins
MSTHRTRFWSTAAVAVLLCGLTARGADAPAAAVKIAIADPVRIFSQLQETKDLTDKLESDRKTLEATILKRKAEINDLQNSRDAFKPDSPQWARSNEELLAKRIEYQNWAQLTEATRQQQQKFQIRSLYEKITQAVQKVAVQRGIDLVLADVREQLPPSLDQITIEQMTAALRQRNILYSATQIDISDQVIAMMDADYKSKK